MRLLAILLLAVGVAGTAYTTWATFASPRPRDLLFGLLAPVAVSVAILGLLLLVVPGFLG